MFKRAAGEAVLDLRAPAKINLWLEVIAKRADGYHDLSSLMLPIGVYDEIRLEVTGGGGIRVECDHPGVPVDRGNLVWRAAELFFESARVPSDLGIVLKKGVPVGAGLGGGSADAAGVLLGLSRLYPGKVGFGDLHAMAARLGADVPFFLRHRPALATGIGEKLQEVAGVPDYPLLLIKPPESISTAWVYGSLKLTRGESQISLTRFLANPWSIAGLLRNDLESVTVAAVPGLSRLKAWMVAQGALVALMSGSGPTVFGVFDRMEEAERAGAAASGAWPGCWIACTRVLGDGEA
ncbi:MAG: 4-(cytidine 5'-diphospho)-2-C-methyl-D-erythritol kinase [Syntrophobacteraceae bacterium]|jgi:4-diphosphocytidyl-2-C-methyl-D-erythritol kinase|nr:4-(cytidine 5'-diphospho)-2-C-methyl-D-erythritol kinase [Syntrophobacteraceae bacterium]